MLRQRVLCSGLWMCVAALTWSCGDSFSGSNDEQPNGGAGGEVSAPADGGSAPAPGGGEASGGGPEQAGASGTTCAPIERRITEAEGSSSAPSLAYNGTGYGVAWQDDRDGTFGIYFALLDAQGSLPSEASRISDAAGVGVTPSLVWTGAGYGVAWQDERDGYEQSEIYFRRLDKQGGPVDDELRISMAEGISYWPSLVWNGTGYALAWSDTRENAGDVYLQLISAAGQKVGKEVRVTTSPGGSFAPMLMVAGNGYALAFNDDSLDNNFEVYFARLDAAGAKLGPETRIATTPVFSQLPRLVATGDGFAAVWEEMDGTAGEVQGRRLDELGEATGVTHTLSTAIPGHGGGDLAWSETAGLMGAVWSDNTDGTNGDVFFARFDASFERSGEIEQITSAAGDSRWPRLVELGGKGWAVAFEDMRDDGDGNQEIYFARLCP